MYSGLSMLNVQVEAIDERPLKLSCLIGDCDGCPPTPPSSPRSALAVLRRRAMHRGASRNGAQKPQPWNVLSAAMLRSKHGTMHKTVVR